MAPVQAAHTREGWVTRRDGFAVRLGCLVAGSPHGENDGRIRRVLLDLLPQPLEQRVDAADVHERLSFHTRDSSASRLKTMPGFEEEHVEQLKLVRGQLHVLLPTRTRRRAGSISMCL